ncbi:unnamed protein product, partial [Amoebophrya sp. A25]|eukprot:GSA25T00011603001.1
MLNPKGKNMAPSLTQHGALVQAEIGRQTPSGAGDLPAVDSCSSSGSSMHSQNRVDGMNEDNGRICMEMENLNDEQDVTMGSQHDRGVRRGFSTYAPRREDHADDRKVGNQLLVDGRARTRGETRTGFGSTSLARDERVSP